MCKCLGPVWVWCSEGPVWVRCSEGPLGAQKGLCGLGAQKGLCGLGALSPLYYYCVRMWRGFWWEVKFVVHIFVWRKEMEIKYLKHLLKACCWDYNNIFFLMIVPFFCDSRKVQKEDRTPLQDSYMQYKVSDCWCTQHPILTKTMTTTTATTTTTTTTNMCRNSWMHCPLQVSTAAKCLCPKESERSWTLRGNKLMTVLRDETVSKLLWVHPWQCLNYCGHIHDSV